MSGNSVKTLPLVLFYSTERNHFEVEYAPRGLEKPIGAANYVLIAELLDARMLEQQLRKELGDSLLEDTGE